VVFFLYHVPEFFQRYYGQPLIWLLELGMLVTVIASYCLIRIQKGKGFNAYGLFNLGKYKFNLLKGLLLGFVFSALANLIFCMAQLKYAFHVFFIWTGNDANAHFCSRYFASFPR
jgi:hypothetical protein